MIWTMIGKILAKNRLSIPKTLCEKYGIKEKDIVGIEDTGNGLRIFPVDIIRK